MPQPRCCLNEAGVALSQRLQEAQVMLLRGLSTVQCLQDQHPLQGAVPRNPNPPQDSMGEGGLQINLSQTP